MTEAAVKAIAVVCKICFMSTSHKRQPTLTPESKSSYDAASKKTKCTVCRQEWAPIRVSKELGVIPAKWVRIRNKPKIPGNVDFQQCNSLQKKIECPKGQDCSYAHSKIELYVWNQERQNEPRPIPQINGPYQFQLCKHMLQNGTCPYGQRCTFAHSEQELTSWLHSQAGFVADNQNADYPHFQQQQAPFQPGTGVGGSELKCSVCGVTCTSKKQLDDHYSGSKHTQQVAVKALHSYNTPAPHPGVPHHQGERVRQRPTLSFPVNGYKLCLFMKSGKRCVYGDFCTFAHSPLELDEWNRQLQEPSAPRLNTPIIRFQNHPGSHSGGVVGGGASGGQMGVVRDPHHQMPGGSSNGPVKQEQQHFDDLEREPEVQDFGFIVRSRVAAEHNAKAKESKACSFEATFNGVAVSEVSGQDLSLIWTHENNVEWMFQLTVNAPQTLHSVVLFDTLASDYHLLGVWLTSGGQQRAVGGAKPMDGEGLQTNVKINPSDKILVKVSLCPRSGLLGQLVVFDIGGQFLLLRGLAVHVLSQLETKLLADTSHSRKRKKTQKPDLYWEQHYSQMSISTGAEEIGDEGIEEYPLPEAIQKLIESGKYSNVENRVTKENYKRRMHNLLYLEEFKQRQDMAKYDLYDIEIAPSDSFSTPTGGMNIAPQGYKYVTITVDEVLFEGGRSIRTGDGAQLLPKGQRVLHECTVEQVRRESVVLKITEKARQACASSLNRCQVRFLLHRIFMRSMHFAVDHLDLDVIFPAPREASGANIEMTPAIKKCLTELKSSELYSSQQRAVESMLDPACQQVPSLVLGPFGCGKTRTLTECVKLLTLNVPEARVLICTHTNSAASLYVESLHNEWNRRGLGKVPMFRMVFSGRRRTTLTPTVQQYCRIAPNGAGFAVPSIKELRQFKIVVATLSTSRTLYLSGLPPGHFTHVFIDEAAQALESEGLIPLCLADKRTKVVLAGDHMQTDPPVYSEIARRYGLHVSLLERLYDHEAYDSGVGLLCKTLLTENHRSHPEILKLPSRLFYKNKLQCRASLPSSGPKETVPPVRFVGVDGQETQDEDSPSYFNNHEGLKVAEQIQQLVDGGLKPSEICVISYYAKQVYNIRFILRQKRLGGVEVHRLDDVQGKEFRALLLSTVRTCSSDLNSENEAGFLTDAKLFNTAVTRAREWLIVVGEPITLCTVGSNRMCWLEFIKQCMLLGSFHYPKPHLFEQLLENRLVSRQLLEKAHDGFFKEIRSLLSLSMSSNPRTLTSAATAAAASQATPTTSQTTPTLTYLQSSAHLQQQILRSKVKEASQSGDEVTVSRITEDLLKLSIDQQALLLGSPDMLISRVREMEQVLRRAGPTAAVMNTQRMQAPLIPPSQPSQIQPPQSQGGQNFVPNNAPPGGAVVAGAIGTSPLTAGLPHFLRQIIESVTIHAKWLDQVLQQHPTMPAAARDNLVKQRTNVHQQMKLVNEQIYYYKEFMKMVNPVQPTNGPGMHPSLPSTAHSQPAPSTVGGMPPNFGMIPPPMQMQQQQQGMFRAPVGGQNQTGQTGILQTGQPSFPAGVVRINNHTAQQPVSMVNQMGGVAMGVAHTQPASFGHHQPQVVSSASAAAAAAAASNQRKANSAFTFGMSTLFGSSSQEAAAVGGQPTAQPVQQSSLVPGARPVAGGSSLSPLEAAVASSSNHTNPRPHRHGNEGDLYYSDDENDHFYL